MRYQEAYELIDAGVITGGVELPVSHNLMEIYFDQAVNDIAMRAVRKKDYQTFSSSGKEYVFTKSNYSGQIYKVEFDQADVPFVDESAIISNVDELLKPYSENLLILKKFIKLTIKKILRR